MATPSRPSQPAQDTKRTLRTLRSHDRAFCPRLSSAPLNPPEVTIHTFTLPQAAFRRGTEVSLEWKRHCGSPNLRLTPVIHSIPVPNPWTIPSCRVVTEDGESRPCSDLYANWQTLLPNIAAGTHGSSGATLLVPNEVSMCEVLPYGLDDSTWHGWKHRGSVPNPWSIQENGWQVC